MTEPFDRDPARQEDDRLLVDGRTEPDAFGELFDRRGDEIAAFFFRRNLLPHTAAELAAETFAIAFERRDHFDPEQGTAVGWLLGIANNVYRRWVRTGVLRPGAGPAVAVLEPEDHDVGWDPVGARAELAHLTDALAEGLASLSPKLRAAVLYRVLLDLPYDEVARRLDCSVGAARVRVSRGLDQLWRHIGAAAP